MIVPKVTMRVTIVIDYEAVPGHYPDPHPKAMALLDKETIDGGGVDLFDLADWGDMTVTVEPV